MNNIMTIVKKEFKDILRDRKTLLMTFVIPIIVMPLLFTFIFSSIGDMASPSEDNKYKIVLETNNPEITALFKEAGIYELVNSKDPINEAYDGKIVAYIIANDINESLTQGSTPEVDLYYDTTSQRAMTAISTVQTMFSTYQNSYLASYLEANHLSSKVLQPFTYNEHAKDEEADSMSLMMLGMLIPMMIIGYSGSGIVPIATDLGAGEKERGTLEPLLSTSISRSSILIGKLIVTATFGSITSILSAVGLLLAFKFGMSDTMAITIDLSLQSMLLIVLLAVLYESIFTPLIRMFSLPLGIIGAIVCLLLTGNTINLYSLIGILVMDGLVAKNGTLLLDYTLTLMHQGKNALEAVIEAGKVRLKPIFMTALTMVVGMLPTALAMTEGSETRVSMAWVIIGGMITSTVFTLIVIPIIFLWIQKHYPNKI